MRKSVKPANIIGRARRQDAVLEAVGYLAQQESLLQHESLLRSAQHAAVPAVDAHDAVAADAQARDARRPRTAQEVAALPVCNVTHDARRQRLVGV